MNIVEFLGSRLDEEEALARAATPGPWYWDEPSGDSFPQGDESLRSSGAQESEAGEAWDREVLGGWGYDAWGTHADQADRDHIARHDPARVLREVEAKRRIVDLSVSYIQARRRLTGGRPSWADQHPDTLLALASVYADHPEYDPKWAV